MRDRIRVMLSRPGEPWIVEALVVRQGGRYVVSELHVKPADDLPDGGLTADQVRGIHIGDVPNRVADFLRRLPNRTPDDLIAWLSQTAGKRQGKARPEEWYAGIAAMFLDALQEAPSRPIAAMGEQLRRIGWDVQDERIRSWVNQSRDKGWLTEGRVGVASGEATAKLEAWIRFRGWRRKNAK